MTPVADITSKSHQRGEWFCQPSPFWCYELHLASIGRNAFEAIADQPIFDNHQRATGARPVTWRSYLEPNGPPRDKRRRITFGAGLLDRLVTALRDQGVDVRGANQVRLAYPWTEAAQPESACSELLQRAYGKLRSLHLLPHLEERISFIAELCVLEPETHVLVVVKNDSEAMKVAGILAQASGRVAIWKPDQPRGEPSLLIKSLTSMAGCTPMLFSWQFVIFLDAELALTKTGMAFAKLAEVSPRIGFLTRDEHQLREKERAKLEGLFGPVLTGNTDWVGISVAWLRPTTSSTMPFSNMLDRNRKQVWNNDPLNRLIARAARTLSDNNSQALETLGLRAAASRLQGTSPTKMPTVTILVENSEHGQQLARLLPGWRLEEAGYTPPPGKDVPDDRVIMTLARAAETVLASSVIVYAAGGNGCWIEDLWGLAWGVDTLIVDVADAYDERSRADIDARAAGYRRRAIRDVSESDPPRETAKPAERHNRKQQVQ